MKPVGEDAAVSPARRLVALRMGIAIVGGMLIIPCAMVVMTVPLMVLDLPELLSLWFAALAAGIASFAAGAAARRLAGSSVWRGWIGAACALGWQVIAYVISTSKGASGVRARDAVEAVLRAGDYALLLSLTSPLASVLLAWLGDIWAARRWMVRGKDHAVSSHDARKGI